MKILVIGDSHGNITNLKHVVEFGKIIGVGAIIHCGDWNTTTSVKVVSESKIPLYTVLGNADIDAKLYRMLNKQWLKIDLGGKKIGVIHKLTAKDQSLFIDCDIVFSGHYHSQDEKEFHKVKVVRPGALEKDINFVIYDTDINKIEFISE